MGIAQAGVAFRPTTPIVDFGELVSRLFNEDANEIAHPNHREFDIRKPTDVMVQMFGDVCFICNDKLAWGLLENQEADTSELYRALGGPELILAFCQYESGGSYGYTFIENGRRTRSRLQTTGIPSLPPLRESGTPKEFENRWLSAEFYLEEDDCPVEERQKIFWQGEPRIDVPEYYLTGRMLYEALQLYFSVCPWETSVEPEYRFFKLAPATIPDLTTAAPISPVSLPSAQVARAAPAPVFISPFTSAPPPPAKKRPWWKF